MNVIGIVCEYNPFHNGHKYQIDKIKELYKDSLIIVCMSSSFTQRGEISIINKFDKTKIALENNIDIVIELPYIFSVQSADIFAHGALKLLNEFKIDTLVFGTESDNLDNIKENALIEIKNKDFDMKVKEYLDKGDNYPTSLNKALKYFGSKGVECPNDLLALSYVKEIFKNNYNIECINIKRTNSYHDITSNYPIVSASNIRNKMINNIDIKNYVPKCTYKYLKNKNISDNKYFELLKYKIISENDLIDYLDVTEGIETRINIAIDNSYSLDELINNIKTKRYTYNRISRMLNHIFCSIKKSDVIDNPEYIKILGFNKKGQEYLNTIKKDFSVPLLTSNNLDYKSLNIEKRVSKLYSCLYEDITKEEKSNKPIIY